MTVDYDQQYRPLAEAEAGIDDPVSVRLLDVARSINNTVARVCAPVLVSSVWPLEDNGSGGHTGTVGSLSASTAEQMILRMGPFYVGYFYNRIAWSVAGSMEGGGNTEWRLYSSTRLYRDVDAITAALKSQLGSYDDQAVSITLSTPEVKHGTAIVLNPDRDGMIWLHLSAKNSSVSYVGYLNALTVTAMRVS
jgi:hypothetical protein